MAGGHPNIPHIAVTTDLASTHSLHSTDDDARPQQNTVVLNDAEQTLSPVSDLSPLSGGLQSIFARSPRDPAFLSPHLKSPTSGRLSLDVPPRSPSPSYASSNEGSSTIAPPSPTLSAQSSVHFATSVALRDNKPGDGTSSLGLLHADKSVAKHRRKPSWASSGGQSSLDETEPDHSNSNIGLSALQRVTSAATSTTVESPTHTHVDSLWERSRSRTRGKKDSADSDGITAISETEGHPSSEHRRNNGKGKAIEEPRNVRVDLEQDSDDADHAPFLFKPFKLASMLDPKDLEVLEALGGINALLKGLGTNPTRGLGSKALMGSDGRPGPGEGVSQRHDREEQNPLPGIVVTAPDNLESEKEHDDDEDSDDIVFSATLDQRRQVYGHNVLPHRVTKSLLALMWLALKDKVLVCISQNNHFLFVIFIGTDRSSYLLLR